jgi:hypothetical protein
MTSLVSSKSRCWPSINLFYTNKVLSINGLINFVQIIRDYVFTFWGCPLAVQRKQEATDAALPGSSFPIQSVPCQAEAALPSLHANFPLFVARAPTCASCFLLSIASH